jgi:glyoxylase-like metal-dependent hydrolase (beta-lactamase superfamily II)
MTYVIGDAAFIGDTLFMPDYGTARADFPGGDARALYRSVRRVSSLPGATRLFLCHDYTRRPGAANSAGKPRSQPSVRTTCIYMTG